MATTDHVTNKIRRQSKQVLASSILNHALYSPSGMILSVKYNLAMLMRLPWRYSQCGAVLRKLPQLVPNCFSLCLAGAIASPGIAYIFLQ